MNLLQSQQEKARAEFVREPAMDDYDDVKAGTIGDIIRQERLGRLDSIVSSTVTAVLERVKEVMPGGSAIAAGMEFEEGWNAYHTALLKSLEEMGGNSMGILL